MSVPCGKCNFCLLAERVKWTFRCAYEMRSSSSSSFITLTYDEEHVPKTAEGLMTLCKRDVQLFMKKLRKLTPCRYYLVGEYGGQTERPHYHIIAFNVDPVLFPRLSQIWGKGMVDVGTVTGASIAYVVGYVVRRFETFAGREKQFALMSRRPGIGAQYVDDMRAWHKRGLVSYVQDGPVKLSMPRLYRDKIFNEHEKAKIRASHEARIIERYWKEIEELIPFHNDPMSYFNERLENAHARLADRFSKIKSKTV